RGLRAAGWLARSALAGARLLHEFTCAVDISDVLERKQIALAQHRSQMSRLVPDPAWRTLGDVDGGEFLRCFFQPREIFRRSVVHPA
ncbi:MAG: hypothetical protein ACT4P5_16365, partial [Armatimonadota bacterium]